MIQKSVSTSFFQTVIEDFCILFTTNLIVVVSNFPSVVDSTPKAVFGNMRINNIILLIGTLPKDIYKFAFTKIKKIQFYFIKLNGW